MPPLVPAIVLRASPRVVHSPSSRMWISSIEAAPGAGRSCVHRHQFADFAAGESPRVQAGGEGVHDRVDIGEDRIEAARGRKPAPGDDARRATRQVPSGWRTRSMLATAVVSFVAGALTWHLVGFWTFVSGIVFNPQDGRGVLASQPHVSAVSGESAQATAGLPKTTPLSTAAQAPALPSPPAATAGSETLADLLQCTQARKGADDSKSAVVQACPPLRRRLPTARASLRANRQLDAREAAERLARGWHTGVSAIETGALPARN